MVFVDESASVIESDFGDGTRVYRNSFIKSSTFDRNCLVGDLCRIDHSIFGYYTWVYPNGMIYSSSIGDYSYAQKNASIWNCTIGKYCSISWNVSIGGGEHDYHRVTSHSMLYAPMYGFVDTPLYDRFERDTKIGNDVWIGAGAHILRGVSIGDGAVVAAGAVVTKNIEPYSIVAGVPAKPIGSRCSKDLVKKMLELQWWNLPESAIRENIQLFSEELNDDTVDKLLEIKLSYRNNR